MSHAETYARDKIMHRVRSVLDMSSIVVVRRPVLVHAPRPEGTTGVCPCGCGSKRAVVIREEPHLDVMIDIYRGTRSVRQHLPPERWAEWDQLAASPRVKTLYCPARVSETQRDVLLDSDSKVIYINGGTRGGKTTIAAERLFSQILARGGRGARFAWVAPSRDLAWTGVTKLIRGEATDRWVPPVVPKELLRTQPRDKSTKDWTTTLVEGTELLFLHAGRDGGNLKSMAVRDAVFDEATESKHEENFTILRNRLMDSKGTLTVPTTPKAGHWLKKHQHEKPSYAEAREVEALGQPWPYSVRTFMTAFQNPWLDHERVRQEIEEMGGKDNFTVRREYYGEWVGAGDRLWVYFDPAQHVRPWAFRNPERNGYVNLTPAFGRRLFYGESEARILELGGMDFNVWPTAMLVLKVVCPKGADTQNPANHKLLVEDEVIMKARSTTEFATFVAEKAGKFNGRGLRPDHYAGLHIVADANGDYRESRFRGPNVTSDYIQLRNAGFCVRAPTYNKGTGNPANPPRHVRHALVNQLFHDNRLIVSDRCKILIESLETETDDGTGDQGKRSSTLADRKSAPTDALGYVAFALFGPDTKTARHQELETKVY